MLSSSGWNVTPMTKAERKKAAEGLPKESFYVCAQSGTERPFTGRTANGTPHSSKADGVYVSAMGGVPLFDSAAKYDSGTGWPSFFQPIDKQHVLEVTDKSLFFMPRTEVVCAKSGAHLGHVFNDGVPPTPLLARLQREDIITNTNTHFISGI